MPHATFKSGDTLVDPGAWSQLRKTPAVKHHLAHRRLVILRIEKPSPEDLAPPKPDPLPPEVDADGDGVVDLSAMNAKAAVAMAKDMILEDVEKELAREDRSSVIKALEKRRDKLSSDGG